MTSSPINEFFDPEWNKLIKPCYLKLRRYDDKSLEAKNLNTINQKTDSKQTDQPSTSFVNPFFQQKPVGLSQPKPGLSQPKPGPSQPKPGSAESKPGSSQPKPDIRLDIKPLSIPLTDIKDLQKEQMKSLNQIKVEETTLDLSPSTAAAKPNSSEELYNKPGPARKRKRGRVIFNPRKRTKSQTKPCPKSKTSLDLKIENPIEEAVETYDDIGEIDSSPGSSRHPSRASSTSRSITPSSRPCPKSKTSLNFIEKPNEHLIHYGHGRFQKEDDFLNLNTPKLQIE